MGDGVAVGQHGKLQVVRDAFGKLKVGAAAVNGYQLVLFQEIQRLGRQPLF